MQKQELKVIAFASSESSPGNFILMLESIETQVRLPIIIGAFEAQAIAVYLEKMKMPRPLTHELFKNTLLALDVQVSEVIIHDLVDGVYISWLILKTSTGEEIRIDARTSDAIALAVRFNSPITTYDQVIQKAGINADYTNNREGGDEWDNFTVNELEDILLEKAETEDYETAAMIRDLINKKIQQNNS
ncbi:MAG: bifunctional nuclease family protein [Ferruginibacter sp.]|nr:bifunctional nuclease family protein [Ferruginibacter sp.]